jgi:5'-methylthioadenosine phosphorylase
LTRITKVEQSNNWAACRAGFSGGSGVFPAHLPRVAKQTVQSMLAIIGGSGLTRLSTLAVAHREVVRTPYGEPSSALTFGQIAGRDVVFLARHGYGHTIPPHRVNYRANLWALKEREVDAILAVASVGSIALRHAPGDLVLPHQLVDYSDVREGTFFDGGNRKNRGPVRGLTVTISWWMRSPWRVRTLAMYSPEATRRNSNDPSD